MLVGISDSVSSPTLNLNLGRPSLFACSSVRACVLSLPPIRLGVCVGGGPLHSYRAPSLSGCRFYSDERSADSQPPPLCHVLPLCRQYKLCAPFCLSHVLHNFSRLGSQFQEGLLVHSGKA